MPESELQAAKPRRKSGSEKREKYLQIGVRVTQKERDKLAANADCLGLTLSAYVREGMLERTETRQTRRPPVERELLARTLAQLHKAGSNLYQLNRHLNFGGMPEAAEEYRLALLTMKQAAAATMEALGRSRPGDHQRRESA